MTSDVELPDCLEDVRIKLLPATAYYIPDFITGAEEDALLEKIYSLPSTQWTQLSKRRLKVYPSRLTAKNVLLAAPLPAWLRDPIVSRLRQLAVRKDAGNALSDHIFASSPHGAPNHVLINEYEPGQGIMPHEDGSAYWPVVATVSLAAPIVLDIYDRDEKTEGPRLPKWRLLQEPRSLLVTTDNLYVQYLHGIAESAVDENLGPGSIANWDLLATPEAFAAGSYRRRTRTSLTYRDVLKVSHFGDRLKLFRRAVPDPAHRMPDDRNLTGDGQEHA